MLQPQQVTVFIMVPIARTSRGSSSVPTHPIVATPLAKKGNVEDDGNQDENASPVDGIGLQDEILGDWDILESNSSNKHTERLQFFYVSARLLELQGGK